MRLPIDSVSQWTLYDTVFHGMRAVQCATPHESVKNPCKSGTTTPGHFDGTHSPFPRKIPASSSYTGGIAVPNSSQFSHVSSVPPTKHRGSAGRFCRISTGLHPCQSQATRSCWYDSVRLRVREQRRSQEALPGIPWHCFPVKVTDCLRASCLRAPCRGLPRC